MVANIVSPLVYFFIQVMVNLVFEAEREGMRTEEAAMHKEAKLVRGSRYFAQRVAVRLPRLILSRRCVVIFVICQY